MEPAALLLYALTYWIQVASFGLDYVALAICLAATLAVSAVVTVASRPRAAAAPSRGLAGFLAFEKICFVGVARFVYAFLAVGCLVFSLAGGAVYLVNLGFGTPASIACALGTVASAAAFELALRMVFEVAVLLVRALERLAEKPLAPAAQAPAYLAAPQAQHPASPAPGRHAAPAAQAVSAPRPHVAAPEPAEPAPVPSKPAEAHPVHQARPEEVVVRPRAHHVPARPEGPAAGEEGLPHDPAVEFGAQVVEDEMPGRPFRPTDDMTFDDCGPDPEPEPVVEPAAEPEPEASFEPVPSLEPDQAPEPVREPSYEDVDVEAELRDRAALRAERRARREARSEDALAPAPAGEPRVERAPTGWDCACGSLGNTGAYCGYCGTPRPVGFEDPAQPRAARRPRGRA